MSEIDLTIRASLEEFAAHVRCQLWYGREREAVSYYAFGFLLKQVGRAAWLTDPAQITIEGAVRQRPGSHKK